MTLQKCHSFSIHCISLICFYLKNRVFVSKNVTIAFTSFGQIGLYHEILDPRSNIIIKTY